MNSAASTSPLTPMVRYCLLLEFLEVLVVCQLHLVAQVDDFRKEHLVVHPVVDGILHAPVEVDGEHALGACGDPSGPEGVAEAVVLYLVAEPATRAQRVGIVAHVCEERVSLRIHLSSEIAPFLVDDVAILGEQGHGFHGECQHRLCALLVEPLHEPLLKPGQSLPVGP